MIEKNSLTFSWHFSFETMNFIEEDEPDGYCTIDTHHNVGFEQILSSPAAIDVFDPIPTVRVGIWRLSYMVPHLAGGHCKDYSLGTKDCNKELIHNLLMTGQLQRNHAHSSRI